MFLIVSIYCVFFSHLNYSQLTVKYVNEKSRIKTVQFQLPNDSHKIENIQVSDNYAGHGTVFSFDVCRCG